MLPRRYIGVLIFAVLFAGAMLTQHYMREHDMGAHGGLLADAIRALIVATVVAAFINALIQSRIDKRQAREDRREGPPPD